MISCLLFLLVPFMIGLELGGSHQVTLFPCSLALSFFVISFLFCFSFFLLCNLLGCTDAAPRPAHPRPTRRDAGTRQGRHRPRVPAASDRVVPRGKARIGPTRLKSAPIRRKSAPTRPKSGRLGPYRPYRPVSAEMAETAESGRN